MVDFGPIFAQIWDFDDDFFLISKNIRVIWREPYI